MKLRSAKMSRQRLIRPPCRCCDYFKPDLHRLRAELDEREQLSAAPERYRRIGLDELASLGLWDGFDDEEEIGVRLMPTPEFP